MTARRVDLIADLLMAGAHADHSLNGQEVSTVKQLLCRFMNVPELPEWLEWRVGDFNPAHFDLQDCIAKLDLSTQEEKRTLLELVTAVHESDDTWDLDEDAYLRQVAKALGLAEEDYADLTISELSIDRISRALIPPPLPKT